MSDEKIGYARREKVFINGKAVWRDIPDAPRDSQPSLHRNSQYQFKKGNDGRPAKPPKERWPEKYKINEKTGCYEWKGKINKSGRGLFFVAGRNVDAQKYAWFIAHKTGDMPENPIRNSCTTPCCVNPEHLYEVINRKKRRAQSILTKEQVIEIRHRYANGEGEPIYMIAKEFKASEQSIRMAATGKSYTWVKEN